MCKTGQMPGFMLLLMKNRGNKMHIKPYSFTAIILAMLILFPVPPSEAGSCGYRKCWGAVGFGPNGAYGFSYSFPTQRQARNRASRGCRGGCTVIRTFYNSCGAIAAGEDNGWGWGYAASERQAKQIALNYCYQNSYNCNVRAWSCSK